MRFYTFMLAAIVCATPAMAGFFDFFGRRDVEVITTTDVTPDGSLIPTPSKEKPIYYQPVNVGYRDFGGIIAGDKIPPQKNMIAMLIKALGKQGYIPATKEHPASQVILFCWGTMYVEEMHMGNPDLPGQQVNYSQILKFLGGEKMGIINKWDPSGQYETPFAKGENTERIKQTARDNLYIAVLASYDIPSTREAKVKLLWRTKIGCPAVGLVMSETLPEMITAATPFIGRDTPEPVWMNATDNKRIDVKIGETTVVRDYVPPSGTTVIDHSKVTPEKKKK